MTLVRSLFPKVLRYRLIGGRVHYPHRHATWEFGQSLAETPVDDNANLIRGSHPGESILRSLGRKGSFTYSKTKKGAGLRPAPTNFTIEMR